IVPPRRVSGLRTTLSRTARLSSMRPLFYAVARQTRCRSTGGAARASTATTTTYTPNTRVSAMYYVLSSGTSRPEYARARRRYRRHRSREPAATPDLDERRFGRRPYCHLLDASLSQVGVIP